MCNDQINLKIKLKLIPYSWFLYNSLVLSFHNDSIFVSFSLLNLWWVLKLVMFSKPPWAIYIYVCVTCTILFLKLRHISLCFLFSFLLVYGLSPFFFCFCCRCSMVLESWGFLFLVSVFQSFVSIFDLCILFTYC